MLIERRVANSEHARILSAWPLGCVQSEPGCSSPFYLRVCGSQLAVCLVSLFVSVCRSCVSSSSVQRPPIPRWCPVRAWLFFTFLPTYSSGRALRTSGVKNLRLAFRLNPAGQAKNLRLGYANRAPYCYVYARCPLCIRIVICILTDP